MLRSQRLSKILELVHARGAVTVDEQVEKLEISPATARRDLDALDEEGQLKRTRGGAESLHGKRMLPDTDRIDERTPQKKAIGTYCTQFLQPGFVVGMTGGSTIAEVANALIDWSRQHATKAVSSSPILTVVTNAIDVAYRLSGQANIKIVVIGGQLNQSSFESTGPFGIHMLEQMWFDIAFIGVNGFDENGPGTVDEYEASTNRKMVQRCEKPYIVADSSKFGKRSFSSIGGPDSVRDVVTDDEIESRTLQHLREEGYEVHVATML